MILEAITEEMERDFSEKVLKTLLSAEEMEKEKSAPHPIAAVGMVCGCDTH